MIRFSKEELTHELGQKIANDLDRIEFSGDIIPAQWLKKITDSKGNADLVVIAVLARIVFWSRNKRDASQKPCGKRSSHPILHKSKPDLERELNLSENQIRRALKVLRDMDIIESHVCNNLKNGRKGSYLYIALHTDVLESITKPELVQDTEGHVLHHLEGMYLSTPPPGGAEPKGWDFKITPKTKKEKTKKEKTKKEKDLLMQLPDPCPLCGKKLYWKTNRSTGKMFICHLAKDGPCHATFSSVAEVRGISEEKQIKDRCSCASVKSIGQILADYDLHN